jgi:hypothetical protein
MLQVRTDDVIIYVRRRGRKRWKPIQISVGEDHHLQLGDTIRVNFGDELPTMEQGDELKIEMTFTTEAGR